MIELIQLNWQYLAGQPVDHFLRLLPWHLSTLLLVMGLLSALGLHFLIGHLFGFYRRKGRHARWIAWPTGLVLFAAVLLLLGAYLLGTRAQTLTAFNLTERLDGRLGEMLLAPAFASPALAAQPEDAVSLSALRTALFSSPEADYRASLMAFAQGPAVNGAPGSAAGNGSPVPGLSTNEWHMAQIGLRWVASPHRTWLAPLHPHADRSEAPKPSGSDEGTADGYFLPEFLLGLVGELPPDAVLSREDWEHVAGTRFVGNYLEPLLVEYLSYLAMALALVVLLVLVVYFLLMARLRRIGQPKPVKGAAKAARKGKPQEEVSIPATADLPVTAEATAATNTETVVSPASSPEAAEPPKAGEPAPAPEGTEGETPAESKTAEAAAAAEPGDGGAAGPATREGEQAAPETVPPPAPSRWKALSGKLLPGSRRS